MPRYKLRVPQPGEDVRLDDGTEGVVAGTLADAREAWDDVYGGDCPQFLHSRIGRCHVLYKRDIDAGDCFDDAEPGDTMWWLGDDDGRELASHEFRCWLAGPPPVHWRMVPVPREPITADRVPVGSNVYHRRLGCGRTVAPGYSRGRWWWIDVDFGWPDFAPAVRRACKVSTISITQGIGQSGWPSQKYRLEVAGEVVAEGGEWAMHTLRDARIARLNAEWEAAQAHEAVAA